MTDIALDLAGKDIALSGADLGRDSGLRTAVMISLFTDRRAAADDIVPDGSGDRRGSWMDSYTPGSYRIGSRLWLLGREKETAETLRRAREYAAESLQWLVDDGVAKTVAVIAERLRSGVLALTTTITLTDGGEFDDVFEVELS